MQKALILDLDGHYGQAVARRVRANHVFCEVYPGTMTGEKIRDFGAKAVILVGGSANPMSVCPDVFQLGVPIMGIGSGCTLMAKQLGGNLRTAPQGPCRSLTQLTSDGSLFDGLPDAFVAYMDHSQIVDTLPEGFIPTASADNCPVAGFCCPEKNLYGIQFHPELAHTQGGNKILSHFLHEVCGFDESWNMERVIPQAVAQLQRKIGNRKVLLALSGGVDSSVAAALLAKAVGNQLTCIFVDHGMLRKDEGDQVEAIFDRMNLHFIRVNAAHRFLNRLKGVTSPEEKRNIIGEEFVRVFEEEAKKLGAVDFLAQGTIYPDIIEGGQPYADVIKSHRNMDDLPEYIDFKELIEPLRMLFKEEVRELGHTMGLPAQLLNRQPFPGPGLAIRIIGEVTPEKIAILQEADAIFRTELERGRLNDTVGQYFAVLTDTQTTCTLGDPDSEGYTLALRAITTDDYTTAKWARLPYELLDSVSGKLLKEVKAINRIVYDITNKPPATIEWE